MESASDGLSSLLEGSLSAVPDAESLRQLQNLKAAVNGMQPPKKLQPLSSAETDLHKAGRAASGFEKSAIKPQLNSMNGAGIAFESGGSGKATFDDGEDTFTWTLANTTGSTGDLVVNYSSGAVGSDSIAAKGSDCDVRWKSPREMDQVLKRKWAHVWRGPDRGASMLVTHSRHAPNTPRRSVNPHATRDTHSPGGRTRFRSSQHGS